MRLLTTELKISLTEKFKAKERSQRTPRPFPNGADRGVFASLMES